jgi:uncharacterized protein
MNARLQSLAATHAALWFSDPWYQRAWFVWPQAVALVIAGWLLFPGTVAPPASAPWAAPVPALTAEETDALRNSAEQDGAAFERLKRLAEYGDQNAEFSMGTLFDPQFNLSTHIKTDANTALGWYKKAADQGQVTAQYNLGDYLYTGRSGIAQNYPGAVFWLSKAAAQDYVSAELELGFCYEYGSGVTADPVRAVQLFWKAAQAGDAGAQNEIGRAYRRGYGGIAANPAEAFKWFEKSAAQGYARGEVELGFSYENGTGVAADPARAIQLFWKNAQAGDSDAENEIGRAYTSGTGGMPVNLVEAFSWYQKSAAGGSFYGMYNLGTAYAEGRGTARNIEQARMWLTKAIAAGSPDAQAYLAKLPR